MGPCGPSWTPPTDGGTSQVLLQKSKWSPSLAVLQEAGGNETLLYTEKKRALQGIVYIENADGFGP